MYLVRNITTYEIPLHDLRISLKANQQQDLDMICARTIAEQSGDLKQALIKGQIKIVNKDGMAISNKFKAMPTPSKNSVSNAPQPEVIQEIRELEKRLNERHDLMMRKHMSEAKPLDEKTTETLNLAIEALKSLAGQPKASSAVQETQIDNGKAVDIQQRVINRVSKDSKGSIKTEESKEKSNINKNVDELGDLLG